MITQELVFLRNPRPLPSYGQCLPALFGKALHWAARKIARVAEAVRCAKSGACPSSCEYADDSRPGAQGGFTIRSYL